VVSVALHPEANPRIAPSQALSHRHVHLMALLTQTIISLSPISAESNELQNTAGLHNLRPNDIAAADICALAVEEPGPCETTA
jgi:hypothetical protein